MLATLATTQRDTYKAVESGREVVGDGLVGAVEEVWTVYLAHPHGIVVEDVISLRIVAEDAFGCHSIVFIYAVAVLLCGGDRLHTGVIISP